MHERPKNNGEHPQLTPAELERLIWRVKSEGVMSDVDYVDIQPQDQPQPHFYILEIDPAVVQHYKNSQGVDLEEVRTVLLEYDDPRLLYSDGPILAAKVAITVESYIYNDVDPSVVYLKDVTYSLSIKPDAQWEVMESYYDATVDGYSPVNQELIISGEEKADDARILNSDDLSVLRLFI